MSDRKPLRRYKRQVRISKKEPLEGCYAYCLDGHPKARGSDCVSRNVRLPSCHCCDYFFVEEVVEKGKKTKVISLVEIKDLSADKQELKDEWADYFFGRKKKDSKPDKSETDRHKEATQLYAKAAELWEEASNLNEEAAALHKKATNLNEEAANLYEEDFYRKKYLPWKCAMQIYGSMAVFGRLGPADENLRDCERYKFFLVIDESASKKAPRAMALLNSELRAFLTDNLGGVLSKFLVSQDKNKAKVCSPDILKEEIKNNAVLPKQSNCSCP